MSDNTTAPAAPAAPAPVAPAAPAAPAAPSVDPGATNPPVPAANPPAPGAPAEPAAPAEDSPWSDPVKAEAEIKRLRRESGNARTQAKQTAADEARQELAQTVGKALGLVQDETPPDPAALATAAQEATNRANQATVELAAYKAAGAVGANPAELLDRRSVASQLDNLDPTAEDFDAQVAAVVKKAVTDNPQLLAQAPVAGASSTDHAGGSGEVADLDAQIATAEKAGDHRLAIALKRRKANT